MRLIFLSVVVALSAACLRPDPQCQGKCDHLAEVCQASLGSAFLQNGNPNPFGEDDSYSCLPLPDRCIDERTCDCVICEDDDDVRQDCLLVPLAGGCSDPVDQGPVLLASGCVE